MTVIDANAQSESVQVIRCDFKRGSIERSKDVENGMISEKTAMFCGGRQSMSEA
jgi:hypothetical protein